MGNLHQKRTETTRQKPPQKTPRSESPTLPLSHAAIMKLQRTIGNQAVQRLLVNPQPKISANLVQRVKRTDAGTIQRDALDDASPLWWQVSDGYHEFIGKLGMANQKAPTVTRQQWMRELGEQWAKVGEPGEKSDAELRQLEKILKQYKTTIKAENDQAQQYWIELRKSYDDDPVWNRTEVWADYARKLLKETFIETRNRVKAVGDVLTFEDLVMLEARIVNRTHEKNAEKRQHNIDNLPKRKEPRGYTKFRLRMLAGGEVSVGPVGATTQTYSLEELGPGGRKGALTFTAVGAAGGAKAGGGFYSTASEFTTSVPMRLEDFQGGGRIASGGLGPVSYSVVIFYCGDKPAVTVEGLGAQVGLTAGASWMHGLWELRAIY